MVIASEKSTGKLKKRGADATTITLSISMEDKELAKKVSCRLQCVCLGPAPQMDTPGMQKSEKENR